MVKEKFVFSRKAEIYLPLAIGLLFSLIPTERYFSIVSGMHYDIGVPFHWLWLAPDSQFPHEWDLSRLLADLLIWSGLVVSLMKLTRWFRK